MIEKKVAYLKGLAEGLALDENKPETKIINAMLDILDELAMSVTDLEDAMDILGTLRESFSSISALDYSGPLMQNTQQVYAGLTYGKGILNETCLDPSQRSRGFMA